MKPYFLDCRKEVSQGRFNFLLNPNTIAEIDPEIKLAKYEKVETVGLTHRGN